jgi:hypothetical protein
MNEQYERDGRRREREDDQREAGAPEPMAMGAEADRTVPENQEPEETRPFGERLAAWLQRNIPEPTRDSKATEKMRSLVLLGVTAIGGFFLFFGLFTTDSDSTKVARPIGPSLGRPQQQTVNPETANRSAVPQLSVNRPVNEETGDLTEKDVLGTMRNRGGTPLEAVPVAPVAPKPPAPVNLGQIDFDDPALAEAYRRQGRVPLKRPPEVADWNRAIAQQQASQRPSVPAAPPALPAVNSGESLRKSSLVFVRTSVGVSAPPVSGKAVLDRKAPSGLLPQGSVLVARLQHAVSSAAKAPVVAVIEYNYEQGGELIVPAGTKAYGELSQATPQGWVGIKFHTLEFPNGEKEAIAGSALSMERGVLKGEVNGKNSGKKFLTRALTGMGTIAAYAVGGRGLGSSINGIDSSILLRERLASNIAMAGEQEMAMLAYQQNIVVTVPANTRFYLVLHQAGVTHSGAERESVMPGRRGGAADADRQGVGSQEVLSTDEIRDLRQLRNEMRQMNQMLLQSQPISSRPENQ